MFRKWMTMVLAFLLMLGGCGTKESTPAEAGEKPAGEAPAETTEANPPVRELDDAGMQKLIDAYATVLDETFGAEIDFSAPVSQDEIAR